MDLYDGYTSTFSEVVPYVLDIGHGNIRAGWGGDATPSRILPSLIGTGDGYNVFPVVYNSQRGYPYVTQIRNLFYNEKGKPELKINKLAFLRAVSGIIGEPRADDRRLLNAVKANPQQVGSQEALMSLGVDPSEIESWDELSCNVMPSHYRKPITNLNDLTYENALKALNSRNTAPLGMGEAPSARPLFLIEGNEPSSKLREDQLELIMEYLQMPGTFFGQASTLATYFYGLSNAVVIDVGAATTTLGVVVDDRLRALQEHHVGGDHVDALLYMLLREAGENALNGVFHHPCYSFGTQLWDNLYKEQLPATLATKLWKRRITSEDIHLQELIKDIKHSSIHVAPYPMFTTSAKEDAKYRDILRAAMPKTSHVRRTQTNTLPDGTVYHLGSQEPATPENIKRQKNSWVLLSSQRSNPQADGSPRTIHSNGTNPFENVCADSLLAAASEILFDPREVADRLPVDVGNFKGIYGSFESFMSRTISQRSDVYRNIIIMGGCANMAGFMERIANDFNIQVKKSKHLVRNTEFKVHRSAMKLNKSFVSWVGASMLSSLSSFDYCWITQEEYRDHGNSICHKKGNMSVLRRQKMK